MDRGLSLLFRLMSASWVLLGSTGCEKNEKDTIEELDRMVIEEFDQEEERLFSQDGTFD